MRGALNWRPIAAVERAWSVGQEIRERQREAELNALPLPTHKPAHPRHCTACGGTADKPFERLTFYRVRRGNETTVGWSCNGKPLQQES